MKNKDLIIGALILVGGYVVYTRFIKKPKDESNDAKNGKQIGTEPQQTNPNVQQTCGGANVRCAKPSYTSKPAESRFSGFIDDL